MSGTHNATSAYGAVLARREIGKMLGKPSDEIGLRERGWFDVEYEVDAFEHVYSWNLDPISELVLALNNRVPHLQGIAPKEVLAARVFAYQFEFAFVTLEALMFFQNLLEWERSNDPRSANRKTLRPLLLGRIGVLPFDRALRDPRKLYTEMALENFRTVHKESLPIFQNPPIMYFWQNTDSTMGYKKLPVTYMGGDFKHEEFMELWLRN